MIAAAPLKVVILGAWTMLFRASPWAAVRNRYISRSLRKEIPKVAPAVGIALNGWIWVALPWVKGMPRSLVKFLMPGALVPTTSGVRRPSELSRNGLTR